MEIVPDNSIRDLENVDNVVFFADNCGEMQMMQFVDSCGKMTVRLRMNVNLFILCAQKLIKFTEKEKRKIISQRDSQ